MTTLTPSASSPRSAVVTGGAGGIGRAIATRLVARGYAVVVSDIDEAAARRTAQELGAAAGVGHDVRDPEDHRRVLAAATAHAPLGVWVNNAGLGHDGTLASIDEGHVRALVEVNLLGVAWGSRVAVEAFGSGGGDLINIASLSALGPVPGLSVYAATKAAVVSLTTSLDTETPRSLHVHALCPDGVDTPLVAGMAADGQGRALVSSGGRLLTTDEVADAAVALIGTRRVVRTLPAWRGVMMRATDLAPSVLMRLEPLMRRQGTRAVRRHQRP
ncbi:SDR family NAD(P)-dependent oxidoreductase [Marmoricola endophyticus]|nr:SDR family NAD(P)-dependent oxidoreductase [Marmoricola endophyticus]